MVGKPFTLLPALSKIEGPAVSLSNPLLGHGALINLKIFPRL
jgi:hypothetical protein